MTGARIDAAEIAAMLAARIVQLAPDVLPNGVGDPPRGPRYWRVGSIAGETGNSLAVTLSGPKRGRWCDYNGAEHGDALDLVAQALFGGDMKRAIAWAKSWLGLSSLDRDEIARTRATASAEQDRRDRAGAEDEAVRKRLALRLFLAAQPLTGSDPASLYLKGRGIDLTLLPRPVRSLRFHPALYNRESDQRWPALVAAISGADGKQTALHRTWLTHQDGRVVKAPLRDAKRSRGTFVGGAIHLWRGASNKPFREAVAGERVIVSEGIEDGLSAVLMSPETRTIVAVSLSNMGSLVLPDAIGEVVIAAQNDAAGSKAEAALARACRHFRSLGKTVRLLRPPVYVKDLNELLQRESAA